MEKIDPAKAARVWQRVQGDAPQEHREQGIGEMIAREWTAAVTFVQLSRRFQGKESAILQNLYEQKQSATACLKGIYTLITGSHPTVKAVQPPQEDTEHALRRCYGREMRSLAGYEARRNDPEYGQVFTQLANNTREHCRMILELIGNLKKKT